MPRAARTSSILSSLSAIEIARPSELILQQLRHLITSGALRPGDRLPAERDLAAQFGVGRSHVRDALRRLEFYGILETHPQSGTVVARLGVAALNNLIGNVLALDRDDIAALLETRVILEVETARLAADRAPPPQLRAIAQAQDAIPCEGARRRPGAARGSRAASGHRRRRAQRGARVARRPDRPGHHAPPRPAEDVRPAAARRRRRRAPGDLRRDRRARSGTGGDRDGESRADGARPVSRTRRRASCPSQSGAPARPDVRRSGAPTARMTPAPTFRNPRETRRHGQIADLHTKQPGGER